MVGPEVCAQCIAPPPLQMGHHTHWTFYMGVGDLSTSTEVCTASALLAILWSHHLQPLGHIWAVRWHPCFSTDPHPARAWILQLAAALWLATLVSRKLLSGHCLKTISRDVSKLHKEDRVFCAILYMIASLLGVKPVFPFLSRLCHPVSHLQEQSNVVRSVLTVQFLSVLSQAFVLPAESRMVAHFVWRSLTLWEHLGVGFSVGTVSTVQSVLSMCVLNFPWSVVFRPGFLGYLFGTELQPELWILFTYRPCSLGHFLSPLFHVYVKVASPSPPFLSTSDSCWFAIISLVAWAPVRSISFLFPIHEF